MRFSILYEKVIDGVFASKSEEKYDDMKIMDVLLKCEKMKLEDNSWRILGDLNLNKLDLESLKNLNVSKVDRNFSCSGNNLISLDGCPKEIGGDFFCSHNYLTSLKGSPIEIKGNFDCSNNSLTSLDGMTSNIGGNIYCFNNANLTNLAGAPTDVDEFICCYDKMMRG